PYGMGNPVPRLLIRNAWFEQTWHQKIKDPVSKRKLRFIKTHFFIKDDTSAAGFPGLWWDHYKDDLPTGRCDAVVELDFNTYSRQKKPQYGGYEVRLIDVRPTAALTQAITKPKQQVIDRRSQLPSSDALPDTPPDTLVINHCPTTWQDLRPWFHQATQQQTPLVLAYDNPQTQAPIEIWKQLAGIAKYLARIKKSTTGTALMEKLNFEETSLQLGLRALGSLGFQSDSTEFDTIRLTYNADLAASTEKQQTALKAFLLSLQEEQFQRSYFCHVPVSVAQAVMED
ncbi:MAG: single-stranded-DNA-specific exonuclease RecJ, partial [Cyanobacteria bacterium P01_D01_bin.2]